MISPMKSLFSVWKIHETSTPRPVKEALDVLLDVKFQLSSNGKALEPGADSARPAQPLRPVQEANEANEAEG